MKIRRKNKDVKKNLEGRICEGLHFEGGIITPYMYIDGRGFAGKGSVTFWGEAGEGCTLRKQA